MALKSGRPGGGVKFGARKNEFLPFLVMRANPGDKGNRPLLGPFWESPDIFVQPNQEADTAPTLPSTLGASAVAGAPNTLWAHVWNVGRAPAHNVRVEFYWFDPTTGFSADGAHLIGATHVDLGARDSTTAHTVVKCPVTWRAQFLNGGHECIVVRCFEPMFDALGPNPWNPAENRHVGQRNIHVAEAQSPAELKMLLRLGCSAPPGRAEIQISREKVENVPWLALLGGKSPAPFRNPAHAAISAGVMSAVVHGSSVDSLDLQNLDPKARNQVLRGSLKYERKCDELAVPVYIHVDGLERHEASVFRVIHRMDGRITGGYTVIAHKP